MTISYKVSVISNFVPQADNPEVQKLMGQIFVMKNKGYRNKHQRAFLPFAQDDLYGIHVVISDSKSDAPIIAFKVIPYSIAQSFENTKFPFFEFIESICTDEDINQMKTFVKKFTMNNQDISYSGGWAVNPDYKGLGRNQEFKDIYTAIHYHVHKHFNLYAMTAIGIMDFKTFDFFKNDWGAKAFNENVYNIPGCEYIGCKFIYFETEHVAEKKKFLAGEYKALWDNRAEYIYVNEQESMKKAA